MKTKSNSFYIGTTSQYPDAHDRNVHSMKHNKTKILEFKTMKDPIKVQGAFLILQPRQKL